MKKATLLKIVNLGIALLLVVVAGSAMAASLFHAQTFELHQYAGYAFVLFAVFHIVLNWTWIKSNFFKRKKAIPHMKETP
jgi:hypothetical protein